MIKLDSITNGNNKEQNKKSHIFQITGTELE